MASILSVLALDPFVPIKLLSSLASPVQLEMTVYDPKEGIEASVGVDVLATFKGLDVPLPYLRLDLKRNNVSLGTIATDGNGKATARVTFSEPGTHRIESTPSDPEEFRRKLGSDLISMPYASQSVNVASVKPEAMIQCSREITRFPVSLNDKPYHSGDTVLFPLLGNATFVKAVFPALASGVYALQSEVVEKSISSDTVIVVNYNAPTQMLLSLSGSPGKSVEGNVDVQVKGVCSEPFEGVPVNVNGVDARTDSNGRASIPYKLSSAGVFSFSAFTKTPISVTNSIPLTIVSVKPQALVECSKEAVNVPLKVNGVSYTTGDTVLFPLPKPTLEKPSLDLKLEYPEVSNGMYTKTPTIDMKFDKNVTPFALYNAPKQLQIQTAVEKACAIADELIKGTLSAKVLNVCGDGFPNVPIDLNGTEYMSDGVGRISVPFSVKGPGTYDFKLTTKTPVSISETKSITVPACAVAIPTTPCVNPLKIGDIVRVSAGRGGIVEAWYDSVERWTYRVYQNSPYFDVTVLESGIICRYTNPYGPESGECIKDWSNCSPPKALYQIGECVNVVDLGRATIEHAVYVSGSATWKYFVRGISVGSGGGWRDESSILGRCG